MVNGGAVLDKNALVLLDKASTALATGYFTYRQLDDLASKLWTSYVGYTLNNDLPGGIARFHLETCGTAFRRMSLMVQMSSEKFPNTVVRKEQLTTYARILEEAKFHMQKYMWYVEHDLIEPDERKWKRGRSLPEPETKQLPFTG